MSSTILTLDEINLLKYSEEPKNTKLYGNLYEVLSNLEDPKAISLNQLDDLNSNGIAALTYNKKSLLDSVIQEWYAEKASAEDYSKKVRCGLCNTPNKYLYYIRNRKNNNVLNVGSSCITKFPGIEGYFEQKIQMQKIYKNNMIIKRRNEFYNNIPNVEMIIDTAKKYFNTLPILLPFEIYNQLEDTINRMGLIYNQYVNYGKKPFKSVLNSFELFNLAMVQYEKLKILSEEHLQQNIDNPIVCKRREIDWLISKNKHNIIQMIAENDGYYTEQTVRNMCNPEFVFENKDKFITQNTSKMFKIMNVNESYFYITFNKLGYQPPIVFTISLSDFMRDIGYKCVLNSSYKYKLDKFLIKFTIRNSIKNIESIIKYISNDMKKLKCSFLIDYQTNRLILRRNGDKCIRMFDSYKFLKSYSKYINSNDEEIISFLTRLVEQPKAKWITASEQEKQGFYDKVWKLYREQIKYIQM